MKQNHIISIMENTEEMLYKTKMEALNSIRDAADFLLKRDPNKYLLIYCIVENGARVTYEDNFYNITYGWNKNEYIGISNIAEIVEKLKEGKYEVKNKVIPLC